MTITKEQKNHGFFRNFSETIGYHVSSIVLPLSCLIEVNKTFGSKKRP